MERERFLVVGMQRSGTTVTHATLAGHPRVSVHPQELHASLFRARPAAACPVAGETAVQRREAYLRLFDALSGTAAADGSSAAGMQAAGMKTAIEGHADAVDVANCLRDYLPGVRIVLVGRDDPVAQLGSLRRAQASGRWHSTDPARRPPDPGPLRLDPEEVVAYAADARRAVAQLRTLADTHPLLELRYERDIATGAAAAKLWAFLGLDAVAATWVGLRKVSPDPASYIAGYSALRDRVAALPAPDAGVERAFAAERRTAGEPADSPLLLLHRALLALQTGRPRAAHDRVLAAIDAGLDGPAPGRWAFELLENAWRQLGDVALAEATLAALAPGHADDPDFAFLVAVVHRHCGRPAEAEAALRRVLEQVPDHHRATALLREWHG